MTENQPGTIMVQKVQFAVWLCVKLRTVYGQAVVSRFFKSIGLFFPFLLSNLSETHRNIEAIEYRPLSVSARSRFACTFDYEHCLQY